jgi:hypothetical protein
MFFCNNWGYVCRMGNESERKRKGGIGLYYNIDMNDGQWNDRWVMADAPVSKKPPSPAGTLLARRRRIA